MQKIPACNPKAPVVVIDIGNTHTTLATWHEEQLKTPLPVPTGDEAAFDEAFAAHCQAIPNQDPTAAIIASVVPAARERICECLRQKLNREPLVIGDAIPLPMDLGVTDKDAIGTDRVCAAFAAYDRLEAACTVIDFGTAVTVDLVDIEGVLVGGAILPGLRLQLEAMHEHTASLPGDIDPEFTELAYGRNTIEAMQTGVCRGLTGAVRALVEAYAASLNYWPQVVATGGDLPLLGPHCDFIDTQVKDLTLRGIGLAYTRYLAVPRA